MCIQWLIDLFRKPEPPPTLPMSGKGLAMATYRPADLDLLGVDWWYVWHWLETADVRYVPMARNWYVDADREPPAYLLLGNEPNYWEPWGSTMSPEGAAWYTVKAEELYPDTVMVVGNVSQHDHFGGGLDGAGWLTEFLAEYRAFTGHTFTGILGCHLYVDDTPAWWEYELQRYRDEYDGPMWLTELAMPLNPANPKAFSELVTMAASMFERISVYTNEQDGSGSSLPFDMDLSPGGVLTEIGEVYAGL